MSAFITLFRVSLKFYFSTRRFLVILPFYVFISVFFPILVIVGIAPRSPDIYTYTQSGFLTFSFSAALVSGLLAGDALSKDFTRQGIFILSQPVKRSTILLSRYAAALVASSVIMVFFYDLIGSSFAYYIYGQVVPTTWLIPTMSLMLVASMVAFVMLCSSVFKNSNVSITVAILSIWIVMPLTANATELVHLEPWFLLTYAGNVLQALAQKAYPPAVQSVPFGGVGSGFPSELLYNPTFWESVEIILAYLIVSLLLAWVVYSRRELQETI